MNEIMKTSQNIKEFNKEIESQKQTKKTETETKLEEKNLG